MESTTDENDLCALQAEQARVLSETKVIELASQIVCWYALGRLPESLEELEETVGRTADDENLDRRWQQHTAVAGTNLEEIEASLRLIAGNINDLADLYGRFRSETNTVFQVSATAHDLREQAMYSVLDAVVQHTAHEHQVDL